MPLLAPSMKILFDQDTILARVRELGAKINQDFRGEPVVVVGVMKGSFIFLADLVRTLSLDLSIEFIGLQSYEGKESTGEVRITHDLGCAVDGKNILLVEDIIDTGTTIDFLLDLFKKRNAKSLRTCALLSKPEARTMHHPIDYVGFEITKEFVVGYGLDLDGRFRQLPNIMQITADVT